MTREEATRHIESIKPYAGRNIKDALDMAIKALDQEPYEKFKSAKDHICKLAGDYKCWDNRLTSDEALELCHILEQESILDKIRAEIEANMESIIGKYDSHTPTRDMPSAKIERNSAREECLQIIDKYKAESEDKE